MFVVGHPGHRRIRLLQDALVRAGRATAQVVSYADVLADPHGLRARIGSARGVAIKIDSPGEDDATTEALVARGWRLLGREGGVPAPGMFGELRARDAWFAGFAALLGELEGSLREVGPRWLNAPADIVRMGDKLDCQRRFIAHGVPVPALLGAVDDYEALRERLRVSGHDRVFVKARFGSSAAGVVAYRRRRDGREIAETSACIVDEGGTKRIVNRLRLQRLDDSRAIAALIDALGRQGCYVEQWLPKPSVPGCRGMHYDIRMVVGNGCARQRVGRASASPMTNLHLGNRRGRLEEWVDADTMQRIERTAEAAAAVFPASRCVGIDLMVRPRGARVFEANAFGDLLPGIEHAGCSSHDDQVAAMCESEAADA